MFIRILAGYHAMQWNTKLLCKPEHHQKTIFSLIYGFCIIFNGGGRVFVPYFGNKNPLRGVFASSRVLCHNLGQTSQYSLSKLVFLNFRFIGLNYVG